MLCREFRGNGHPPVMCVTKASLMQGKQLLQLAQREVPRHLLLLIHHAAAQCLLVALALQDLLLNGSCLGGQGGPRDAWLSHPQTRGGGAAQENPGVETIAIQEKGK